MKNLLKSFIILLAGAALGMFIEVAPSLRNLVSPIPWTQVFGAWFSLLGMWLWMSAPILLVTGIIMSLVLSRDK